MDRHWPCEKPGPEGFRAKPNDSPCRSAHADVSGTAHALQSRAVRGRRESPDDCLPFDNALLRVLRPDHAARVSPA